MEQVRVSMSRELSWTDVASAVALLRYFRANRFAFVQTHTPKASMLALPAARLAGHKTVYTMHGALYFRGNRRLPNIAGWLFERWCCSWAHVVGMQSKEDTEVLPRALICPARKVRYQGNGIDFDRFAPRPPSPVDARLPVVLNISRLVSEKGCLDFFNVAERLAGQARFLHVGPTEADQRDAVDPSLIRSLEQRGIVEFVGDVRDVRPYLADADLFVLPSYREGIPRACMEAAAMGVAVVAYDVRGVREVVAPGLGLLAPRGDTTALIGIVSGLLHDPRRRAEAAQACETWVRDRFDERLVYDRLRTIYADLPAGRVQPVS